MRVHPPSRAASRLPASCPVAFCRQLAEVRSEGLREAEKLRREKAELEQQAARQRVTIGMGEGAGRLAQVS